ncbi:MAG TPA: hypothetical protein VEL68_04920 [Thermodesulfobacteriota bacterium]|nr:hypothetical protein [Thermodesulfobacteriota bacterium]
MVVELDSLELLFNSEQGYTTLENVLIGIAFSGRKGDLKEAKRLLAGVGLPHRLKYYPSQISFEEQQRVTVGKVGRRSSF